MAGRVGLKSVTFACVLFCAAAISAARADEPVTECNKISSAADSSYTNVTVRPFPADQQSSWQRMGRDIEIKVENPALPANPKVRVFLCWKVDTKLSSGAPIYFVASNIVRIDPIVEGTKNKGLKIQATVPELDPAPDRFVKSGENVGIYAQNNAFPIARVRTLIYDDKDDTKVIVDKIVDFGVIAGNVYCDYPFPATTAGSGIVGASDHKNWQPTAGEINFEVKVTQDKRIPADTLVKVCFRWQLQRGDNPGPFRESGPTRIIERNPDSLKISAIVPYLKDQPPRFKTEDLGQGGHVIQGRYSIPYVAVPLADVRVLLFDSNGYPIADVPTSIGITDYRLALAIVFLTLMLAYFALRLAWHNRLSKLSKVGPLLCIITSRNGNASLSQFQIMLWTFVVAASTVYVIALSGELISITNGTLVLLGISGASGVVAKIKSENDAAAEPPPPTPTAAAAEAEAARGRAELALQSIKDTTAGGDDEADAKKALAEANAKAIAAQLTADAAEARAKAAKARIDILTATDKAAAEKIAQDADAVATDKVKTAAIAMAKAAVLTRLRHPSWSDLVMEESEGREIDVSRVQMLLFTVITAVFVLLRVGTSFVIPDIPEGFLLLMGISNSVYVGSKFATNPAAK